MTVSLLKANDLANEILVSDQQLMVVRKGIKKIYALSDIRRLSTGHKTLLFPLILGGIITPFAFLSYFTYFDFPWIHLIAFFTGFWLLFTGISGKASVSIHIKNSDTVDILLPSISLPLKGFIDFFNDYLATISHGSHGFLVYFDATKDALTQGTTLESSHEKMPVFPLTGYTRNQLLQAFGKHAIHKFTSVDPFLCQGKLKFIPDAERVDIRPILEGPIPPSAISPDS